MAVSANDRVKASKLRDKKTLKPDEKAWLDRYEQAVTKSVIRHAKTLPDTPSRPKRPAVGGEQLAIAGTSTPSHGLVHETSPEEAPLDPGAYMWTPTVAPPAPDAEPLPPGAPPPPAPGSPIIDEAAPGPPPPGAAPSGPSRGAVQFAGIMCGIASFGLGFLAELAAANELPPELAQFLQSDEAKAEVIKVVAGSAMACAGKWGLTELPFADEAVLAGTLAITVLAGKAVFVRRAAGKGKATPTAKADAAAPEAKPKEAPSSGLPPELGGKWGG